MQDISCVVAPIPDHAFFEQTQFKSLLGDDFLQVVYFTSQMLDLIGIGSACRISGEPLLASFQKLLRPANGMDGSPSDPTG